MVRHSVVSGALPGVSVSVSELVGIGDGRKRFIHFVNVVQLRSVDLKSFICFQMAEF